MYARKVKLESIIRKCPRGHIGKKSHTHTYTHTCKPANYQRLGSTFLPLTRFNQDQKHRNPSLLLSHTMPQACVSMELISETNKENQVCEERGFSPLFLGFGHPARRAPHRKPVPAPSGTLTFRAPLAQVPAAPESASPPCSFRFLPAAAPQVSRTLAFAH